MVARALSREAFDVTCVPSQERALSMVRETHFDVVVVPDFLLPQEPATGMIRIIRTLSPHTDVIISSTHPGMHAALTGVRESVLDYVRLPEELDRLSLAARKAIAAREKPQAIEGAEKPPRQPWSAPLLGTSVAIAAVRRQLENAADTDAPVLLVGETGTGKDAAARFLHTASSHRAACAFMKVNCSAASEEQLASELFGYERGVFASPVPRKPGRIELAHGGTVFFDGVDAVPESLQQELLAVSEGKGVKRLGGNEPLPVDVRMVGAVSPEGADCRCLFADRLAAAAIVLPPLRDRLEDLPVLCDHLLGVYAAKYRKPPRPFSTAVLAEFQGRSWPGNVRELESVVSRHAFGADA